MGKVREHFAKFIQFAWGTPVLDILAQCSKLKGEYDFQSFLDIGNLGLHKSDFRFYGFRKEINFVYLVHTPV
jgi:hypothetical protein